MSALKKCKVTCYLLLHDRLSWNRDLKQQLFILAGLFWVIFLLVLWVVTCFAAISWLIGGWAQLSLTLHPPHGSVWSLRQGSWISCMAAQGSQEQKVEATVLLRYKPGSSTASLQPKFKGLHGGMNTNRSVSWEWVRQKAPIKWTSTLCKGSVCFTYFCYDYLVAGEERNPLKVSAVLQIIASFLMYRYMNKNSESLYIILSVRFFDATWSKSIHLDIKIFYCRFIIAIFVKFKFEWNSDPGSMVK